MEKQLGGGAFQSVPSAIVEHPFWKGGFLSLSSHFFNWACGDCALFSRFPDHCFASWPNASESLTLGFIVFLLLTPYYHSLASLFRLLLFGLGVCIVDVVVDTLDREGFGNRSALLEGTYPLLFRILACSLGNVYVIILEFGRLWGHIKKGAWRNIGLRFDWHCGRLAGHRRDFRNRERSKFIGFIAVILAILFFY